jgi:hypothetical protein
MPTLGSYKFSLCTQAIMPQTPDEEYLVLGKPGMGDQAALFFAPRWKPQAVRFFHGVGTETAARKLRDDLRALRRQRIDLDDDMGTYKQALVLSVVTVWRDAGMVLGPGLSGARYELDIVAFVLPAAS